jgi:hypothetical protein
MVDQVQNITKLGSVDFIGTSSRKMGLVGKYKDNQPDPSAPGAPPTTDYEQWIHALTVVNRSGGLLLPGRRVIFEDGTTYAGPYRAISGYAAAGQRGDGVVPWTCPSAGVGNGSVFNIITKGPAKLVFDGVNVAIAKNDLIGGSADGKAAKYGSTTQVANSATFTNTTDAADVATKQIAPANGLKKYDRFRIVMAGTCPSTNSTDTLTLLAKIGGQTAGSTGAIDVANNDPFVAVLDCVVWATGASGSIQVTGFVALKTTTVPVSTTLTVDTTAAVSAAVNADWSAISTSDQFVVTALSVDFQAGTGPFALPFARALEVVAADAADDTQFKCMVDFESPIA